MYISKYIWLKFPECALSDYIYVSLAFPERILINEEEDLFQWCQNSTAVEKQRHSHDTLQYYYGIIILLIY